MFNRYKEEIQDYRKQFEELIEKVDKLTEIVESNSVTIKILEDKADETQCEITQLMRCQSEEDSLKIEEESV